MGITWDEFTTRIIEPVVYVITQAALSCVLNFIFSSVAYQKTPRHFTALASYFGFCHLFFLVPIDLCKFSLLTIYLFVGFYFLSLLLQRLFGWSYQNTLKFFVFLNTLYCFRNYKNKDNIDDFVLTYIVLTGKLFCAVDTFEKKAGFKILKFFTLLSYLLYTPWISFEDFLCMSMNNQRHKNADWWFMVASATPKAIIFRILSHNMADLYYITVPWVIPIVCSIIHGFQYRCRYYFHAQIVELQLLAAGVLKRRPLKVRNDNIRKSTYKRMTWLRPYIFNITWAESSITVKNFLKRFNKSLVPFLYERLRKRRNQSNKNTVLVHSMLIIAIIASYNLHYSVLSAAFLGGVMFQEEAFESFEELYGLCLYKCSTLLCRHRVGPRKFTFYFIHYVLLMHNQFRLSLLFVSDELKVISSLICNNYIILTDLTALIVGWFVHECFMILFLYFMYVFRAPRL